MKKIVLIRHDDGPDDDRVVNYLRQRGIEPDILRPFLGESLPRFDDGIAASVIYGGPFNVFEEEQHPFLYDENRWIEACLEHDRPLLGICQGAQSIAHVLGAYAGPLPGNEHEFGYYEITPREAGRDWFPPSLHVAQAHFHEFRLPAGAELLASSQMFGQQAMRVGNNVFGFQFHAEATPDVFRRWQISDWAHYGKPGAQTRAEQDALMRLHDQAQHDWFVGFLDRFFADSLNQTEAA